ncbi:glycosyltransferase [Ornithinimicrobium sp. W1665]
MRGRPRVAVALTTYSGRPHLAEQLQSIASQILPPDVVHVSDDRSKDGTWDLLQRSAGRQSFPVHLHRNSRNMGVVANMEKLLPRAAASGEIVVLCDQDDRWDPQKLAAVVRAFQKGSTTLWVGNAHLIDEKGKRYPSVSLWSGVHLVSSDLLGEDGLLHELGLRRLVLGQTVTGAAMAIRSDVVSAALPFPPNLHEAFLHDGWLAVFAALTGDIVMEPRHLTEYRQHERQFTAMSLVVGSREGHRPRERADRDTTIRAETARLDLVLNAVAATDSQSFRADRVEHLQSLRNFLVMRRRPTFASVFHHFAKGDYRRFANSARTFILDLLRAFRRPTSLRLHTGRVA